MSCPYTSQQNGKAERILQTLNNITRSLLFQASLPPSYWVEALHTTTYLLNRWPSKTLAHQTPYAALHGSPPSDNHLRVFGCKCYPNTFATAAHKLAPCSSLCVFLGYSENHKGYRCLDLNSNRLIISHHVVFDESSFPFAEKFDPLPSSDFDFLSGFNAMPLPIGSCFRSRVCVGRSSSDVGVAPSAPIAPGSSTCPWPVAAPVSQEPLVSDAPDPESPGKGASTPASTSNDPSAHLLESIGSVAAGPNTSSASATATVGPDPALAIPGALHITPMQNDHRMVMRGKHGFRQPKERLNLHAATLSPLPKTYRGALADPNWCDAMCEEFAALQANDT
jgi:hypothetical protein